jgi:hypothetical protein
MPTSDRFDRNERLFGKEGQQALRRAHIGIVGIGGLGTHVVQQLALLGVGALTLVDHEDLSRSNRNRYVGAWHDDPVPGSPKVDLGRRLAELIDPAIIVARVRDNLLSPSAICALRGCDYVFGCVDTDGARFVLNEFCLAFCKPLFDLASDAPEPDYYGGRVAVVWGDSGCLHCRGLLDEAEVRRFLSPAEILENEASVYGIDHAALGEAGPSVVSVNRRSFISTIVAIAAQWVHGPIIVLLIATTVRASKGRPTPRTLIDIVSYRRRGVKWNPRTMQAHKIVGCSETGVYRTTPIICSPEHRSVKMFG